MIRRLIVPAAAFLLLAFGVSAQTQGSIEEEKQRYVESVMKAIAGNENKPAGEVFENIKMMKEISAGRLLRVMNFGFSRALGVSCGHCHVPGEWAREDKPTKQVARDMSTMVEKINTELLANIDYLRTDTPVINCTTCHRGETQPALSIPPK